MLLRPLGMCVCVPRIGSTRSLLFVVALAAFLHIQCERLRALYSPWVPYGALWPTLGSAGTTMFASAYRITCLRGAPLPRWCSIQRAPRNLPAPLQVCNARSEWRPELMLFLCSLSVCCCFSASHADLTVIGRCCSLAFCSSGWCKSVRSLPPLCQSVIVACECKLCVALAGVCARHGLGTIVHACVHGAQVSVDAKVFVCALVGGPSVRGSWMWMVMGERWVWKEGGRIAPAKQDDGLADGSHACSVIAHLPYPFRLIYLYPSSSCQLPHHSSLMTPWPVLGSPARWHRRAAKPRKMGRSKGLAIGGSLGVATPTSRRRGP